MKKNNADNYLILQQRFYVSHLTSFPKKIHMFYNLHCKVTKLR